MLKTVLANNDSNDDVVGFILYPTFFFLLNFHFPFLPFFFFCKLCSYKVIRKGCVTLGRAVKVFMTADPPPTWEDITVIAAMRGPSITLLTRFMGLFIASSKTLINNVSHTQTAGLLNLFFIGTSAPTRPILATLSDDEN